LSRNSGISTGAALTKKILRNTNTKRTAEHARRWRAVRTRDATVSDPFVYAVTTTGVYCRPGSASRLPLVKNVLFFDSPQAAEAAGYRPSKRMEGADHTRLVVQACQQIAQKPDLPSLDELARAAGMSPYHFHRIFRKHTGLTPRRYALAHRASRVRQRLRTEATVTDAIYESGFSSNSRFYETVDQLLGMKPKSYRAGGVDTQIRFALALCSLGSVLVAQSVRGVCAVYLGDDPDALVRELQDRFPRADLVGADPGFESHVAKILAHIEAPGIGVSLPLDLRGTAFQMRVWQALQRIPVGTTASYTQIAAQIGAPRAVRAVAGACAANPVAILVPCHRVVRSDGGLSGYHWGVERKRTLLAREQGLDVTPAAPTRRKRMSLVK